MARTVLELNPDELRQYQPDRFSALRATFPDLLQQGWAAARLAARILKEKFGASRVIAFGSLVQQDWFGQHSDLDLAAWGIQPDTFFRAVAEVSCIDGFEVNLVDGASCQAGLLHSIQQDGVEL
jgi:predicted nucleotidyltransferase